MTRSTPPFLERFAVLAPHYDVVLSDVWGVVHNGVAAFPAACEALTRFRAQGGVVVLITNAPRPSRAVMKLLDRLRVPREAYDAVVSSGDVTRHEIAQRHGKSIFHIGPERDHSIFDALDVHFAPPEEADYVVCTGLFNDERETPDDYHGLVERCLRRNLTMICANPDLVVERGAQRLYCAGAIAELYASRGGAVVYAGKPYKPIYDAALAQAAAARGKPTPVSRVLAIGDSIRTDLSGASNYGVDCLFVTAGIHAEELGARDNPDPEVLRLILAAAKVAPKAVTRQLAW